jgi:hypothetical protein
MGMVEWDAVEVCCLSCDDRGAEARKGMARASFRAPICLSMRSLVLLPV